MFVPRKKRLPKKQIESALRLKRKLRILIGGIPRKIRVSPQIILLRRMTPLIRRLSPRKQDKTSSKNQSRRPNHLMNADGNEESRVGFGSDVPAFMLKAVDLKQP